MKKIILLSITFMWIFFIFYNSLQTGPQSSEASSRVVNYVNLFLIRLGISLDISLLTYLIRKAAHMFEFFVLALFSFSSFKLFFKKNRYLWSLVFGIIIASFDEFIQLFSVGRSSSVIDVMIDTLGTLIGIGIIFSYNVIFCKKKNKNNP